MAGYSEAVHWKRNIFLVPSGSVGKEFIQEMARIFEAYAEGSQLESFALTAAMTMPLLLLQKPHKEHTCQLSRSRRDSPDLETETRRPARLPKKADSPRFVPINAQKHDFKPAFACSLCYSLRFFCVFWPFFMYPSVAGDFPNKKSVYTRALFWLKAHSRVIFL